MDKDIRHLLLADRDPVTDITLDPIPMKPIDLPLVSVEVRLLAKRQKSIQDMVHPQLDGLAILRLMVHLPQDHKCASNEQP